MASETEFNEFVSFYGDDHKPSKKTELKRKAFENLADIEIDEKCPVKGGKISKGIMKMAPFSKKPKPNSLSLASTGPKWFWTVQIVMDYLYLPIRLGQIQIIFGKTRQKRIKN